MTCRNRMQGSKTGITVIEILVVFVSFGLLLLLLLPFRPRHRDPSSRVKCSVGLKQVTLGFLLWANENEGKLPMEVSIAKGGSREHALTGNLLSNYLVAATEIHDPRVLLCPSDKKRKQATTFSNLTTANISYFLNVDAAARNSFHILAGDRDITNGSPVRSGLLSIPDANAADWASILHYKGGNLALIDGSVHQVTAGQLRKLLEASGTTNRFMIP